MKLLTTARFCCLVLVALLLQRGLTSASSPQLKKDLQALQVALETESSRKSKEEPSHHEADNPRDVAKYLGAQLRAVIKRENPEEIELALSQIEESVTSDAIQRLTARLRAELKVEIEKRSAVAVAEFQAKLEQAGKAVRAATKPADLDATLRNLTTTELSDGSSFGPRFSAERSKVETARQFVSYWQDYLSAIEWNDNKTAISKLESASSLKTDLIPRSEILARLAEAKKSTPISPAEQIAQIMSRTKSLEAIPAAIEELQRLDHEHWKSTGTADQPGAFLRTELGAISAAYQQFKDGFPTTYTVQRPSQQGKENDPARLTQGLRLELLRVVLPRIIGGGAEKEMRADETVQAYLDRLLALASDRLDARTLLRLRELQNALLGERQIDLSPLQPLLAAQNQDEAQQYAPAVASYQSALKNGGDLVPARQIGARLEAIRAAHPAEYAAGMELFVKNPPNYQGRSGSSTSTITIPGASTR